MILMYLYSQMIVGRMSCAEATVLSVLARKTMKRTQVKSFSLSEPHMVLLPRLSESSTDQIVLIKYLSQARLRIGRRNTGCIKGMSADSTCPHAGQVANVSLFDFQPCLGYLPSLPHRTTLGCPAESSQHSMCRQCHNVKLPYRASLSKQCMLTR